MSPEMPIMIIGIIIILLLGILVINIGDTIPDYVHKYVLRGLPSGLTGNSGVIPTSVTKGSSYSEDFTFTLPDSFDENRVSLIGIVANYGVYVGEKNVINVTRQYLTGFTDIKEAEEKIRVRAYPNPANDLLKLKVELPRQTSASINLHDILGKEVIVARELSFDTGKSVYNLDVRDLKEGIYFLSFKTDTETIVKKILIYR